MKQRTIALILSLLLALGLTACGGKEEVAVDLTDVRGAMLEVQAPDEPWLLETDALKNLYGIEADDVQQSASYVTMSGTFPSTTFFTCPVPMLPKPTIPNLIFSIEQSLLFEFIYLNLSI